LHQGGGLCSCSRSAGHDQFRGRSHRRGRGKENLRKSFFRAAHLVHRAEGRKRHSWPFGSACKISRTSTTAAAEKPGRQWSSRRNMNPEPVPSTAVVPPVRLGSIDAYRGFVMLLMMAEVLHLATGGQELAGILLAQAPLDVPGPQPVPRRMDRLHVARPDSAVVPHSWSAWPCRFRWPTARGPRAEPGLGQSCMRAWRSPCC